MTERWNRRSKVADIAGTNETGRPAALMRARPVRGPPEPVLEEGC